MTRFQAGRRAFLLKVAGPVLGVAAMLQSKVSAQGGRRETVLKIGRVDHSAAGVPGSALSADAVPLLDDAIAGASNINLGASSAYSLPGLIEGAYSESRAARLVFTGQPANPVTVTVPTSVTSKGYVIDNQSGQPLTIKYANTSGVMVPSGQVMQVWCDGSSVRPLAHRRTATEIEAGVMPVNHAVDTTDYHNVARYFKGTIADGADITAAMTAALTIAKGVQLPAFEMRHSEVSVPAGCWVKGVYRKTVLRPLHKGVEKMLSISGTGYPRGAKAFVKLSNLMLYNGGVASRCTGVYARHFDELHLQDLIVDGFSDNISIMNGAFVYGAHVRSFSATNRCLYLGCDRTNMSGIDVGLWCSFIHSEFCGAAGAYNAHVEDWATVRFIKCEFDSGRGGLWVGQAYKGVPENAADVVVTHCGFDSCKGVGLKLDTIRAFTLAHNWVSSGRTDVTEGCCISGCRQGSIVDNDFANCGDSGLHVRRSSEIEIRGNRAYGNGQSGRGRRAGIRLSGTSYCTVIGNKTVNESYRFGTPRQQVGIALDDSSENNIVIGNVLRENLAQGLDLGKGSGNVVYGNKGFVSEARGSARIAAGAKSVRVTHGLGFTPNLSQITVTPSSASAAHFWISDATAASFTINLASAQRSDATYVWSARYG